MESALYHPAPEGLSLFETLRFDPGDGGVVRAMLHLRRMERAAALLGFAFDRAKAAAHLDGIVSDVPLRLRLSLRRDGALDLTQTPFTPESRPWRVMIAPQSLRAEDPWLRVKSSCRALYDSVRAGLPKGVDEALFCNQHGALCEGTITNIFVAPKGPDGPLLTPRDSDGCLPGVLRQSLLRDGRARQAALRPDDLTGARFFVGNSLRGLIPATLVAPDSDQGADQGPR